MSRKRRKSPRSAGKLPKTARDEQKRRQGKPSASSESGRAPLLSAAGLREVVESVVIAFVLAFLFRTFEAEAFVIPTGSMAPTLMGRHKDVVCPKCDYPFQVSASDEVDSTTGRRKKGVDVIACTCPMCRYTIELDGGNPQGKSYRSYKGDRILVAKFPYQFRDPERWDVAVFKYPGGAKTNFIKRIVGLPNETVAVSHGDLFVKPAAEEDAGAFGRPPDRYRPVRKVVLDEFEIARKPPRKIRAMLQPVYDTERVKPELVRKLVKIGWPARWSPLVGQNPALGWEASEDYGSFRTEGSPEVETWIRYQHIVPSYEDWQYFKDGALPPRTPRPQLITDFSAYNTELLDSPDRRGTHGRRPGSEGYYRYDGSYVEASGPAPASQQLGLHWVGDLAVECTVEAESESGEAILELREGGETFQCRIDVGTGKARLSIDGRGEYQPTAQTRVRGPGKYRIMFSNIDDQLTLWVNGRVIGFDRDTAYPRLGNTVPHRSDLEPVRIGSRGAALGVSRLKVYRDVYYIAERLPRGYASSTVITDFYEDPYRPESGEEMARVLSDPRGEMARILSDPREWGFFASTRQVAFPLEEDQFLVLGDNSAESKDSRLWENEGFPYYVSREMLIGKALFIYWPHSLDRIPKTNIPIRFFPNFRRMWFVR